MEQIKNHIIHEPCSVSIQKELGATLWKLFRGEVENIYFQTDADVKANLAKRCNKQQEEENVRHRFFLSFVVPCPKKFYGSGSQLLQTQSTVDTSQAEKVTVEQVQVMEDNERENGGGGALSAMIDEAIQSLIREDVENEVVNAMADIGTTNMMGDEVVSTTVMNEIMPVGNDYEDLNTLDNHGNVDALAMHKNNERPSTSRCRKTSPLILKPSVYTPPKSTTEEHETYDIVQISIPPLVAAAAKSMSIIKTEEIKREVPEGYTHEAWILQEGLHKARKLGLHRNSDKSFCPFTCPLCNKKYRNPNGIKYHAKYAHGPKRIFPCEMCDKTYATRHGLAAHRRAHEAQRIEQELERQRSTIPPISQPYSIVSAAPTITLKAIKQEQVVIDDNTKKSQPQRDMCSSQGVSGSGAENNGSILLTTIKQELPMEEC